MSVKTHCLPSGSLGTDEIPVPNISSDNVLASIPAGGLGNGNIRGVVVSLHGLSDGYQPIPPTSTSGNETIADYQKGGEDCLENLLADGWINLSVPYPEDYCAVSGATAIWNDIYNDSGNGSRYLAMRMHWWDHLIEYIHETYGEKIPIVAFGGSWGGWSSLQAAINRQSSIIAYCPYLAATLLAYVNPAYTEPYANYSSNPAGTVTNGKTLTAGLPNGTAGLDIPQNALNPGVTSSIGVTNANGVTIPGMVTYGLNDSAAGWQNTASSEGNIPINSNLDAMITNAYNAGLPIIRNQTQNIHEFTNNDGGSSAVYTGSGPTALSTLSTLSIQSPEGNPLSNLVSGQCAIWASDNAWHTITFTNFTFINYTTTTCSDVSTSLPSTLVLGSSPGLTQTSGAITVLTSGTTLIATFSGVSGNNLTGVTYVSGSGSIIGGGQSVVQLTPYTTTAISQSQILSDTVPTTITLSSVAGFDPSGGKVFIATSSVYFPLTVAYTGVNAGSNQLTGCSYVSGNSGGYAGNVTGNATNSVFPILSIVGCSYSGDTSSTVSNLASVCLTGRPIPQGFMDMSAPYWFSKYVDPIAPRQF